MLTDAKINSQLAFFSFPIAHGTHLPPMGLNIISTMPLELGPPNLKLRPDGYIHYRTPCVMHPLDRRKT